MAKNNENTNSIEQKLLHLDTIVQKLESKDTSLNDSIELFKEASILIVDCRKIVSNATLEIETIAKVLRKDS